MSLIAIMLAVAGILLGLGYALGDKRLKEFGMSELYQSLINAAILGSLILAFGPSGIITNTINSLSAGVQPQSCSAYFDGNSALCFSYAYLAGNTTVQVYNNTVLSLRTSTAGMLVASSGLYILIGTLASVKVEAGFIAFGLQGLTVFMGPLKAITDFLTFAILSIIAQAVILKFIGVTAISTLLPVGLVLRTFYFTRALGGSIIAITIGFFAILPMTYVMGAIMLNDFSGYNQAQLFANADSALSSTSSGSAGGLADGSLSSIPSNPNSITIGTVASISALLEGASNALSSLIDYVGDAIAFIVLQVFLLPTMSLILTVISIRELARLLGSEITFGRFDVF